MYINEALQWITLWKHPRRPFSNNFEHDLTARQDIAKGLHIAGIKFDLLQTGWMYGNVKRMVADLKTMKTLVAEIPKPPSKPTSSTFKPSSPRRKDDDDDNSPGDDYKKGGRGQEKESLV